MGKETKEIGGKKRDQAKLVGSRTWAQVQGETPYGSTIPNLRSQSLTQKSRPMTTTGLVLGGIKHLLQNTDYISKLATPTEYLSSSVHLPKGPKQLPLPLLETT